MTETRSLTETESAWCGRAGAPLSQATNEKELAVANPLNWWRVVGSGRSEHERAGHVLRQDPAQLMHGKKEK